VDAVAGWPGRRAVLAAQPMGCLIEPERVADVGSQVVGVIESMGVGAAIS